jgi:hypothetical protein
VRRRVLLQGRASLCVIQIIVYRFQSKKRQDGGFNKDFTFSKQNKFESVFEVTLE